jgi:SAM-dependent methyltransferase
MDSSQIFSTVFRNNFWEGSVSRSGAGSDLVQTTRIRAALPTLLEELGIRSMLDLACGDFYWMRQVNPGTVKYIGADIVEELIAANEQTFGGAMRQFVVKDITKSQLPKVDLIMCRDCLVHLSFNDVEKALQNINRSGAAYLLTTTFVDRETNSPIRTGEWRPLNLERPPFSLPSPLRVINEGCTEGDGRYADKSLGLWRLPL